MVHGFNIYVLFFCFALDEGSSRFPHWPSPAADVKVEEFHETLALVPTDQKSRNCSNLFELHMTSHKK